MNLQQMRIGLQNQKIIAVASVVAHDFIFMSLFSKSLFI